VSAPELDNIEVDLFIRALHRRHGYDFSQYAPASLKRRVQLLAEQLDCKTISGLIERVMHESELLPRILEGLTVPASDMFRDPAMFRGLREQVFPVLASYPQINIWQAGCAHGQEVYSLAILLEEAGLYERTQIFATDLSIHSLADYYSARYNLLKLDQRLRRNVTFAKHNLVSDGVFCEAHLILCRNVLIYFSNPLQDRVLSLFRDSLVRGGFLCLGLRESLDYAPNAREFTVFAEQLRIYRLASHQERKRA
jgi:chemotaxis protein methyltransferase CheR